MNAVSKKLLFLCLSALLMFTYTSRADEDESEENEGRGNSESRRMIGNPTLMNPKFKAECSSCHMLYPVGLLPTRSWTRIMNGLDKHFGEDASVDDKTKKEILDFLVKNSSDNSDARRGKKIAKTIAKDDTPLRISETQYFIRKHNELSDSVYKRAAIGSKANCLACHARAELGNFNEHEVRIPKVTDKLKAQKKLTK